MISKSFAFAHPTVEARELVDDASMIYHSCVASIHSTDVRESQARGLSQGFPDPRTSSYTMPLVFLFDDSVRQKTKNKTFRTKPRSRCNTRVDNNCVLTRLTFFWKEEEEERRRRASGRPRTHLPPPKGNNPDPPLTAAVTKFSRLLQKSLPFDSSVSVQCYLSLSLPLPACFSLFSSEVFAT